MRRVLLAILLVAAPCGAFALTWDFDDGSTLGLDRPGKRQL